MSSKEVKIKITGDISDLIKKLEIVKDSFEELGKNKSTNKGINSLIDDLTDVNKKAEQVQDSLTDLNNTAKKTNSSGLNDMKNDLSDIDKKSDLVTDSFKDLNKQIKDTDNTGLKNISESMTNIADIGEEVKDMFVDCGKLIDSFTGEEISLDASGSTNNMTSSITSGLIEGAVAGKVMSNTLSDVVSETLDFSNAFDGISENIKDISNQFSNLQKEADKALEKVYDWNDVKFDPEASEKLKEEAEVQSDIAEIDLNHYRKQIDGLVGSLEDQEKAYESLKQQTLEYIDDEEKSIAVKKKLADSVNEAAKSLRDMGLAVEGIPTDKMSKINEDFADSMRNAADNNAYKNIIDDLNKLDKSLDDKAIKTENNRQINKQYAQSADEVAKSILEEADSIKKFGDSSKYSVKIIELMDEDTGEITKRVELLDKAMKDAGDSIEESMDPKAIEECNEALIDYLTNLERIGSNYADKFMTDGVFDKEKYIEYFQKFGKPIEQLTNQFRTLRTQILELAQDENATLEEKAKAIRMINEQAEALRRLGIAAEDITRANIAEFDSSLASQLDNTFDDLFDNDIPETFSQMVDEIQAAWQELNNLEFGNAMNLASNALRGFAQQVVSRIPAQVKVAVVAITALIAAINKLYQVGKQNFLEGLSNIGDKLQPIVDIVKSFGQEVKAAFEDITNTQLDLSSLMAIGPKFEYEMQRVGSIAGSNTQQLKKLTDEAERLGGSTQFTASQVAEAFEYMAMAGYNTDEMLSSISDTLNLAKISGTDLGKTTDIVTDYMTALGMEANQTTEFVDKLAATITSSNTTVELFGTTMKNVGSLAGSLGISMTDLSTAIGVMANAGTKGRRAGTSLKNVLANMANPTDKQAVALRKLGFTADETGSYLITTSDGAVDLAANMKQLMSATENMTTTEKASLLTTVAGKEAMAGLLAIVNQGEDAWDELSATIENSTSQVQYWNECMSLAGKSGKEASNLIEQMKNVFNETQHAASDLGMSTDDLSHAIALLGDDGKVTTDNVKDLLKVIESMSTATGETEKIWRSLDKSGNDLVNTGYDYDATVSAITADTQGLSQAKKEQLINELQNVDTLKEAIKIAKKYSNGQIDMTSAIKENSFATMSYVDKLQYLRNNYKELGSEAFEAKMKELGLSDSIDELREIMKMSDKEFKAYTKNLETVQSMSEQLASAMDEVTKGSLLSLASAIENMAIGAFNSIKPVIQGVSDALVEFFNTWHNGDENVFTFDGLEEALKGLGDKVREAKPNIQQAIVDLFKGLDTFVNGGALDSILDIGTSIITSICDGIQKAKDNGSLDAAIDGAIKKICEFINTNGPEIEDASKTIISSIKDGIRNNAGILSEACDTIYDIINTWVKGNEGLVGELGAAVGWALIKGAIKGIFMSIGNFFSAIDAWLGNTLVYVVSGIGRLIGSIPSLIGNLGQAIVDCVVYVGEDIGKVCGDWYADAEVAVDNWIRNFSDTIEDGIYSIPGFFSDMWNEVSSNFENWYADMEVAVDDWIHNLSVTVENGIKSMPGKLSEFFSPENLGFMTGFDAGSIVKFFEDLWNDTITGAQNWYANMEIVVDESIHNFSVTLENGIKSIPGFFLDMWNNIVTGAQDWYANMEIVVDEAIHNFSVNLENNIKSIPGIFSDIWNNVVAGAQQWYAEMEVAVDNAVHNFSVTLENGIKSIPGKVSGWLSSLYDAFMQSDKWLGELGVNIIEGIGEGIMSAIDSIFDWINTFKESFVEGFKSAFGIHSPSTVMRDEVGINLIEGIAEGLIDGIGTITEAVGKVVDAIKEGFGNIWDKIFGKDDNNAELVNIDTAKIKENEVALNSLGSTAKRVEGQIRESFVSMSNIARNQLVNIANIARNQFVNMANIARNQMVNVSNIIRNQSISWSNIVRNQVQNARNALTSSFISMRNVARTQMVGVSNIIRNQAVSWANIIRNQSQNARNSLTSSFISMHNVVATQMAKCLSTVRNYMTQIKAATSQQMTMSFKVNKTITTTNVIKNVAEGLSSTMGSISRNSQYLATPQNISLGNMALSGKGYAAAGYYSGVETNSAYNNSNSNNAMYFELPVYLDGKVVAKTTARYMNNELTILDKKNSRKRGKK